MTPALAACQVLSVSACCCSMRSKSGWRGDPPDSWLRSGMVPTARTIVSAATRAAEAYMPPILHRASKLGRARMGARQPLEQLMRGVDRRRAVERHQCGRDAGHAHHVGAPAVLRNLDDFDQIG